MTGRDRRVLSVGAIVVATAWLALRGAPLGVASLRALETSTAQQIERLSRANARIRRLPELDDSIASLTGLADGLPGSLLAGTDAATAQVDLMTRLRTIADNEAVRIEGFGSATVAQGSDPLSLAAIVVTVETDLQGLLGLLETVERRSPALAVEAIEVTARDPDADTLSAEVLVATVTVSGWFRPGSQGPVETLSEAGG